MTNLLADGTTALAGVPTSGVIVWGIALVVAFIVVRLLFRIVKKIVGVILLLAVIVVIGGGGLGMLTGFIG